MNEGPARRLNLVLSCVFSMCVVAQGACARKLPGGYMSEKTSQQILDKTLDITLSPDLSHLNDAEKAALRLLLDVGDMMQTLYEQSRHHQALAAYEALRKLDEKLEHPRATRNLLDVYRLFKGPIARGLDGKVRTFLPVDPKTPGRNVYPWGVSKEEIDDYLAGHPQARASLLHARTVVRRATTENLRTDIRTIERYGIVDVLHPGLRNSLSDLVAAADEGGFYAAPYSVAYAADLRAVYDRLQEAAGLIEETDVEFARYLRQRAVDLLRDNYEAGDAAWVTGRFGNLNAQIGSYETYDDELYGVKSFFGASVLVKDPVMSSSLATVTKWLQELEDMMPYENHKSVRQDIPIGVYDVIADFGQARGTNTATILPNESYITRKYGRTILIRKNILQHPGLFTLRKRAFEAAVSDEFHEDYGSDGDLFRTLFHEIGHYLGPDLTRDGRTLDIALEEDASIFEELKADLVSLYVAKRLFKKRYYPEPRLRAVQASGIRRVLRKNRPRKTQTYATMQLMQMNYFLETGLLTYDRGLKRLVIHRGLYHQTVEAMLRQVMALQFEGDKEAADRFIDKYTTWDKALHGRIAAAMKNVETHRYALVRYGALGE
ncbi:MAG: NUDIX hydrolase [Candidatus Krumholzibacteriia bacterium]